MEYLYYALFGIGALIVLLLLIIVIKALAFKPKKEEKVELCNNYFDEELAIKSMQEMIRCKTISYFDKEKEDYDEFVKFEEKLEELFPLVHSHCEKQKLGPKSLLFHYKGESSDKVTVLMSHYDVVPVDEEGWDRDAFSGLIENGVLWGRGTIDTKITLNGVMNAVECMLSQGFKPANDIYMAFAGDEEIGGTGAETIVKYFQENKINVDFVIDEGGGVVSGTFPGVKEDIAVVGIGEKGMLSVKLEVNTNGGHASTPKIPSSIGKLSKAVLNIENRPFRYVMCEPSDKMYDTLARKSSFLYKMFFANMWLFKGIFNKICRKRGGSLDAFVRTTTAFTQMEGSKAYNVLPSKASVGLNLRLIPGDTMDDALVYLNKVVNNSEVKITKTNGNNPSRISATDYRYDQIKKAIQETWGNTVVSPYLMFACSDSRHYGVLTDHVYRFSAIKVSNEERAMVHGNNERIPLETIKKTVNFYINVIKNC